MADNTRERLLEAAFEQIYTHGYQGAALSEILRNAGVHKGSLYHFFAGKKELALAAVSWKLNDRFASRYRAIAQADGPFLSRLLAVLKDTSIRDFERGCPLANLVQEMSNLDNDFDAMLKGVYAEFKDAIAAILQRASEAGELPMQESKRLAVFVVAAVEGAILAAKAGGGEQDYLAVVEVLEGCLLGYGADINWA